MTPKEFKRLYRIVSILLEQGIDELVPARYQPWPGRLARRSLFWLKNKQQGMSRGARIRLAFEALGPIFIKFGQMLSTRRDLLPRHRRGAGPAAGQGASLLWSGRPSPDRREPGLPRRDPVR
jgi:predicted unusual protein kinase regulating ubiquinone biosynthesis (AarF/ABC1/UbiB family)